MTTTISLFLFTLPQMNLLSSDDDVASCNLKLYFETGLAVGSAQRQLFPLVLSTFAPLYFLQTLNSQISKEIPSFFVLFCLSVRLLIVSRHVAALEPIDGDDKRKEKTKTTTESFNPTLSSSSTSSSLLAIGCQNWASGKENREDVRFFENWRKCTALCCLCVRVCVCGVKEEIWKEKGSLLPYKVMKVVNVSHQTEKE